MGTMYQNINRIVLIISIIGICMVNTFAQTEKYLIPTEIKEQTIITEPATLQKGFFKAGTIFSYGFVGKYFDEDNKKINSFGSSSARSRSIILGTHYGLTDRLQVNLFLPYISDKLSASNIQEWPGIDTTVISKWQQDAKGIGDVEFGIYYQLLTEKPQRPSITVRGTFRFITGEKNPTNIADINNFDAPPGSGEPLLAMDLHLRKVIYPFSYTFTSVYNYYFGGNKVITPGDDEVSFRTGNSIIFMSSINYHVNEWIALVNDVMYFHGGGDKIDGVTTISKKWAIIYHPYLYFQIKQFRLVQSIEIPLKGCVYTADPRYILMLQYQF